MGKVKGVPPGKQNAKAAGGKGGDAAKAGGSGRGGSRKRAKGPKKKKKKPLECGESGEYGDLQKKTGENQFDRDHVPSKAALKAKAQQLNLGNELCDKQKAAVDAVGEAIAIPKWLHREYSRTYGSLNTQGNINTDAFGKGGLQAAAKRDVAAIRKGLKNRKMSKECRKKYNDWARQTVKRTNRQYNQMLSDAIKK